MNTPACPGTLKEGYTTYNSSTLKNLFSGKKVFHVLSDVFTLSQWELSKVENESLNQVWYRLKLDKNILKPDSHGIYLLKTTQNNQSDFRFQIEQPGNEHLCLQLASSVFDIETIPNAMIFFKDGHPAILSKPDFFSDNYISLTNYASEFFHHPIKGNQEFSYSHFAGIIDKYVAANVISKERFFKQVIFLWLIGDYNSSPGKFGFVKTTHGDVKLASLQSAKSLRLHQLGPELGAPGGLYVNDRNTPEFNENGHYTFNEFSSFGKRIGLLPARVEKILEKFKSSKANAEDLIGRAFIPEEAKKIFRFNLLERLYRL